MCFNVAVFEHSEHDGSPFSESFRFWGDGNASYVAPNKKQDLKASAKVNIKVCSLRSE